MFSSPTLSHQAVEEFDLSSALSFFWPLTFMHSLYLSHALREFALSSRRLQALCNFIDFHMLVIKKVCPLVN